MLEQQSFAAIWAYRIVPHYSDPPLYWGSYHLGHSPNASAVKSLTMPPIGIAEVPLDFLLVCLVSVVLAICVGSTVGWLIQQEALRREQRSRKD
jgi:hypothetical protein